MTESKICTCPSGDGSLRWPCPKHPAVEQAGGDERAAFNRWIAEQQLCQGSDISLFKLERNGALVSLHELLRDAYQAGQDRAALAQPSPAQAEAERPGVVARVDGTDEDWFIQPEDETEMHNEGLLFSGCELGRMIDFDRIVGELRADRDSWAEQAELRRLAEACDVSRCADEGEERRRLHDFYDCIEPELILSMLNEIAENDSVVAVWRGRTQRTEEERDRLKAENEALRGALHAVQAEVDGNLRPLTRDLVNMVSGLNNGCHPNDIYEHCDEIERIIGAALEGAKP
ncbi:hypothetical protein APB26_14505 [Pseudomonas aeruginosa]|uniref:hypothetical protein n=1 Tax=Pseudomonas aeruginosa TaxID=287 RepID=UPI00071BA224|nr:hypothetical protein [Pseudomonas aeruginosa]KSQ33852.1 hypothetical protein APB26_14505 [Pseudomonas aeruginosa]